ncbi:hypothetical protein FS749_009107 [Ceratobasidium sp. UAMH 11750]|nr:hypothetical protein FS749_009107 [Ceratobasidium sp. UAMH 11750]
MLSESHTLLSLIPPAQETAIVIPAAGPAAPQLDLSYANLRELVLGLRDVLRSEGVVPGDVVAMSLVNGLEFAVGFLATGVARAISAPLNPAYSVSEFNFYLEDTKPRIILLPRNSSKTAPLALESARKCNVRAVEFWVQNGKPHLTTVFPAEAGGKRLSASTSNDSPQGDDVALVLHTSGTTGRPKSVPLTHANLLRTTVNIIQTYTLTPKDRTYLVMPLFHVHGLVCGLLSTLASRGSAVIPPKFAASRFWKDFITTRCNWYTAVPTIHQILLSTAFPSPIPKIRFIRSCSSALAPATLERLEKAFGAPVLEAYAMTEASHQMCSNTFESRVPGTVGVGVGVEVSVRDDAGKEVKRGEIGEVCVRGSNVTKGYWNNDKANKESFWEGRWFRTGDQGMILPEPSAPHLKLTGRIKELINRGGEKIAPAEVDAALLSISGVREAVAFGVPDQKYGEVVWAGVVLSSGRKGAGKEVEERIRHALEGKISKFKIPDRILITDAIPKTATGKVQRRHVRDAFMKAVEGKAKLQESSSTQTSAKTNRKMLGGSVLLLTVSNLPPAHSRRSSVSASVSLPGSPSVGVGPTIRSRGSLRGQRGRGLGGIGGNLGGAEGLVVALSGIGDKGVPNVELSVRNVASWSIVEPPARPPTVVFAPLEAHDTLYTPSAICFVPPMGSTWSSPSPAPPSVPPRRPRPVSSIELSGTASASAVERVVAHVKRVMNELAGTGIPVIAYTPSQAKLPPQIVDAVKAAGCAEIISAPFTTESVREVLTKVGPWSESSAHQALAKPLEPISIPKLVPPTPPSKPSLTLSSLPSASTSYQTQPTSASSHMSTLPSLAPLVPPPPHLAARASYSCPHIYAPALPPCARRRSVDVGGLALALSGVTGHGGGWGGWAGAEEELTLGVTSANTKGKGGAGIPVPKRQYDVGGEGEEMYAELLSQMYTQTGATVDGATSDTSPSPHSASPYPTGRPHSVSDPHIPFAYTTSEPAVQTPPPTRTLPDVIKPRTSHPDDVNPTRREELIVLLDRWEFEPHKLSDADVLACAGLLFEAAFEIEGMEEGVGVRFDQLPPFLRAVRKIYRTQNQYHNFHHALDVFQAVYWFLCRAGVVPPVRILARTKDQGEVHTAGTKEGEDGECGKFVNSLGPEVNKAGAKWRRTRVQGRIGVMRNIDVFALLLAAVGHDVGHPGLSNAFMTNADTPLSRVFDHKSSLEQLHCALLLRLMHKYGMGHLLSSRPTPVNHRPGIPKSNGSGLDLSRGLDGTGTNGLGLGTGKIGLVSYASSPGLAATYQTHFARQPRGFRWLLVQTVLATDMSVHFKWLDGFKSWDASGSSKRSEFRQGVVGLTEDEERLMICQALIKCGDISNPTRPHAVSEHWSKVLLEEWACQATFEQELDLPVTVVNVDVSNGAKQQAQGQVNFIDLFTQPLFSATASVIPELQPIAGQCALNRNLWHERVEELSEATPAPTPPSRPRATSQTQEAHYRSIFPLSLPPILAQTMGQNASQAQAQDNQQTRPTTATRPSSSGSSSTVGAPSLFSPTGSASSVSVSGATGLGPVEPSAVRVAYRASVRKKKSFHRVSWPAPVAPPPPLPIPSPLREQ